MKASNHELSAGMSGSSTNVLTPLHEFVIYVITYARILSTNGVVTIVPVHTRVTG